MSEQVLMRFIECQRCFHRKPIPAGASQVDPSHACIGYREPQQAGPIPRTMAEVEQSNKQLQHDLSEQLHQVKAYDLRLQEVERENAELRQLLSTAWRSLQSRGGYLIQQGQGCESEAAMLARELQRLGVDVSANVIQ